MTEPETENLDERLLRLRVATDQLKPRPNFQAGVMAAIAALDEPPPSSRVADWLLDIVRTSPFSLGIAVVAAAAALVVATQVTSQTASSTSSAALLDVSVEELQW